MGWEKFIRSTATTLSRNEVNHEFARDRQAVPLTLAIDTAAAYGSIALADDAGLCEEVALHAPRGFSHVLFGAIEALLERHGRRLGEIELFAGASGPGSFTGVRVGLAAVKGLAEVTGRPVVAVSNLEALAELSTAAVRCPVLDAQRGEVYAALLRAEGEPLLGETVIPFARFLALVDELNPRESFEWISPDFDILAPLLAGTRFAGFPAIRAPRAMAGTIAAIALRRAAAGLARDPAAIEANYVRRSDAEIFWKHD